MTRRRLAASIACVILLAALPGGGPRAADPAAAPMLSLTGKLRHPQQFDLARLRALPSETMQVSYQTERGVQQASFDGVRLWALLDEAGGIDDPDKAAALHHVVRITAQDGYFVVLSTGEVAPDFGGKPAMIAYRRDGDSPGAGSIRLVMPGDKHGGRYVRDVVTINVE